MFWDKLEVVFPRNYDSNFIFFQLFLCESEGPEFSINVVQI